MWCGAARRATLKTSVFNGQKYNFKIFFIKKFSKKFCRIFNTQRVKSESARCGAVFIFYAINNFYLKEKTSPVGRPLFKKKKHKPLLFSQASYEVAGFYVAEGIFRRRRTVAFTTRIYYNPVKKFTLPT